MTNKLIEAADELARASQDLIDDDGPYWMSYVIRALTAYRAARESAGEVEVKPLAWDDLSNEDGGWLKANIEFGHDYSLMSYENDTWGWFTSFKTSRGYSGCQGKGLTMDDAKAAAQSDYARRIRSALAGG